ncbi:DUF2069 domain-containing protein [Lysobacter sp. A3-1-A15]|uniref:DUF2069 domain-containing protein n=1 Tax=Novilysobacter viscosus TaxID=3098602 RepID=UPI003982F542
MTGPATGSPHRGARVALVVALLALAGLYLAWFALHDARVSVLAFTALPPLLLAVGVAVGLRTAGFMAAVLALAWFSHGVMVAWSSPDARLLALLETVLAVVIVFAASWPGLAARFGRKRG